jgi:ABC-type branched-subunit amino acid transport system ATPase component
VGLIDPSTDGGPSQPLFGCEGISLRLAGRQILEDVSLSVRPGVVLGLAGPNGAGKTSLFEVLTGRYRQQSGTVFLAGEDVTKQPPYARVRRGLARTYQRPVVPFELTVGETLEAARKAFKPYPSRHQMEWAATLVRLRSPMHQRATALETLARRKLMSACLRARRPKVLLLDEPAAGMNPQESRDLMDLIRWIRDEFHLTIVLVEHNMKVVMGICETVQVIDHGEAIAVGPPAEIQKNADVIEAYLGAG